MTQVSFSLRSSEEDSTRMKGKKRQFDQYNPVTPRKQKVDIDSYRTLMAELGSVQPDAPFLGIADTNRWLEANTDVPPPPASMLPDVISANSELLVFSCDICVETSPPQPDSFMDKIVLCRENLIPASDDIFDTYMYVGHFKVTGEEQKTLRGSHSANMKQPCGTVTGKGQSVDHLFILFILG